MTDMNLQPVELVVENGRPMATSLQIARHFGKSNDDVLFAVNNLKDNVPPEWFARNFIFMSREIETGYRAGQREDVCLMTRDGFCLALSGSAGKKTTAWRAQYLTAFNDLEEDRRRRTFEKYLPLADSRTAEEKDTAADLALIEGLLSYWANRERLPYRTVVRWLCAHLDLGSLDDFTADHFTPAWDFLNRAIGFLGVEERPLTPEELANVERLLAACSQFEHTHNLKATENLRGLCGASLANLPATDPERLTGLAWGLFRFAQGYTMGYSGGQATLIGELVK